MYQYSNSLIRKFYSDVDGNAAIGVKATVFVGETGTVASLFESNGTTPKENPVTTDQFGFYSFSLADGDYRIVFSSSQFATLRISVLDGAQIREDFESISGEFDALVTSNTAFRNEQQAAYDAFVLSQGWTPVGTFAAGFTFTSPNQVGQDAGGIWWRWNGALPKTVTAGTLPSSDANYKLVGDGVLRSDLANGTADVGGVTSALLGSRATKWAVVTDPEFGADNTGSSFATDAFMAAQAASDFIIVPAGVYSLDPTKMVRIFSNKTWFFMNPTFTKPAGAGTMFSAEFESDFNLMGAAKFVGNATVSDIQNNENFTGETALYIESCASYKVGDLNFRNIAGYGLKMSGTAGATPYFGERGRFGFLSGSVCHFGMDLDAGNGSEYNVFTGYDFSANRVGLRMGAGNNVFSGGSITGNRYANVWLTGGSNNGHGTMSATTINHAGVYNVFAEDVTVGFAFEGCQLFGNAPNSSSGQVFIRNSKGITFNGGILDCWVNVFGGDLSGNHKIANMWCAGSYGTVKVYDDLDLPPKNMIIEGCYGDGSFNAVTGVSINSPEWLTILGRGPNGGQPLTLGTYTVLSFPDALKLTDDRRAWNGANNLCTVPAESGGLIEVSGRLTFQTTGTIDIKTSRVRILVNGAVSGQTFRAYSKALAADDTDIMSIQINSTVLLKPSDTLQFEASIEGTGTPVFSDPDGRMFLTIKKVK